MNSIQYGQNENQEKRLMLCSEVALGNSFKAVKADPSFTSPPSGYDSIHGMKSTVEMGTSFIDDEYVIFNLAQHKMKYFIEYSIPTTTQQQQTETPENENITILPSSSDLKKMKGIIRNPSSSIINTSDLNLQLKNEEKINKPSGLIVTSSSTYIDHPCKLEEVRIFGKIIDLVGEITLFQEFISTNDNIAQAKYIFPLDEDAAVVGFEAFVNGKHIIGTVKEKEQAKEIYQHAIDKGYGAYLMTQHTEQRDLFCLNIGNILPNSRVIIKISYITELKIDSNTKEFKLTIPNTIRQTSLGTENSIPSNSSKLTIQLSIIMPFDIQKINCSENIYEYNIKQTRTKASLSIQSNNNNNISLNNDIDIMILVENTNEPRLYIEKDENGHFASMLSISPFFDWNPPVECEFLFLIDRSASMKNNFSSLLFILEIIKNQLKNLLLNPILKNTIMKFNIIGFGGSFEWLFINSQMISNESIYKFEKYLQEEFYPDLGGSDLWLALNAIYLYSPNRHNINQKQQTKNINRAIYLISDGLIAQKSYTLNLIKENSSHTRLFTIGIGNDINKACLQKMSQLGNGNYLQIKENKIQEIQGDNRHHHNNHVIIKQISSQISSLLLQSLQPNWNQIHVQWGLSSQQNDHNENNQHSFQSPAIINSLFHGERVLVFYLGNELYTSATIKAKLNEKNHHINEPHSNSSSSYQQTTEISPYFNSCIKEIDQIVSTHEMAIIHGKLLHKLAARSILTEWENGIYTDDEISNYIKKIELQNEIIDLSIKYQIISNFTAFVAIEERYSDTDKIILSSHDDFNNIWNDFIIDDLKEISWEKIDNQIHNEIQLSLSDQQEFGEEEKKDEEEIFSDLFGFAFDDDDGDDFDNNDISQIVQDIENIQNSLPSGVLLSEQITSNESRDHLRSATNDSHRLRSKHVQKLLDSQKVLEYLPSSKGSGGGRGKDKPDYFSSSSGGGGGGGRRVGGAVKNSEKQNEIQSELLNSSLLSNNEKNIVLLDEKIMTPFGFFAIPISQLDKNIQKQTTNSFISHLFQGPLNSGGDCWLNAVLMLCFSIKNFQKFLFSFSNSFSKISTSSRLRLLQNQIKSERQQQNSLQSFLFISLDAILTCWKSFTKLNVHDKDNGKKKDKKLIRYREGLFIAQKRILQIFDNFGFISKDPQCAIRIFKFIEDQIKTFLLQCNVNSKKFKSWISLDVSSWNFSSNHWKLMKKKINEHCDEQYIVLLNYEYSSLPFEFVMRNNSISERLSMNGYSLYSFISFEKHQDSNHFKTFVLLGDSFALYNDILHIGSTAGGYQGGIFTCDKQFDSSTISFLSKSCSMVPICVFKRS